MRESSILASLDELKAIHVQRVADEHAAKERDQCERDDAVRRADAAAAAAELARVRETHEAERRLHAARAAAEHEARLRVEAAEAAERARFEVELAAQREAGELVLRREAIAKQRPRWMIAVTALALCTAVALGALSYQNEREAAAAHCQQLAAQVARDRAAAEARAAKDGLERVDGQLAQLHDQVQHSIQQVTDAQADANRARANAAQQDERRRIAEEQQRRADAKRRHDDAIRKGGIHSEKCVGTALGCLDPS